MFKINIITQLFSFFVLAILVNQLNLNALVFTSLLLAIALSLSKTQTFLRTIKRLKWFFLVMIIIFVFNTPGEHVVGWPFTISPTYEGLRGAFMQTLRIMAMLAALSLLLASNSRQQLISGFYFICLPLKYAGLKVERFAARLWLTLHYVESQPQISANNHLLTRLKNMTPAIFDANSQTNNLQDDVTITFEIPKFTYLDHALIIVLIITIVKIAAKAFA